MNNLHVFFTLPDNGCPQKLNHVAITNTNIVVIEGFYFLIVDIRSAGKDLEESSCGLIKGLS
jgi:hypothetical protein